MIIPLFLEQLLIMLVGMADTLVVSYAGEAPGMALLYEYIECERCRNEDGFYTICRGRCLPSAPTNVF